MSMELTLLLFLVTWPATYLPGNAGAEAPLPQVARIMICSVLTTQVNLAVQTSPMSKHPRHRHC